MSMGPDLGKKQVVRVLGGATGARRTLPGNYGLASQHARDTLQTGGNAHTL